MVWSLQVKKGVMHSKTIFRMLNVSLAFGTVSQHKTLFRGQAPKRLRFHTKHPLQSAQQF